MLIASKQLNSYKLKFLGIPPTQTSAKTDRAVYSYIELMLYKFLELCSRSNFRSLVLIPSGISKNATDEECTQQKVLYKRTSS